MSIEQPLCPYCGKEGFHMHKVSTPITFTTEAERLKARSLTSLIATRLYGTSSVRQAEYDSMMKAFDDCFPPIAPPKMVPFELTALVDNEGKCIELGYVYKSGAIDTNVTRETRVRVTEIDDE